MRLKLLLGLLLQIGAVSLVAVQGQTRADAPGETRPILPGEQITQEIGGRKVDRYSVRLEVGQYIRFTAKELGINVVVAVSGPSGATILELNRSNGTRGQESVSVIADKAGSYVFQVRPYAPVAARGQYEASITEPRLATEADRAVVVAESAFARAQKSWTRYASRRQQIGDELQPILEQFAEAARLAGVTVDRKLEAESLFS